MVGAYRGSRFAEGIWCPTAKGPDHAALGTTRKLRLQPLRCALACRSASRECARGLAAGATIDGLLAEPYKFPHVRLRAIKAGQFGIWRIFQWHRGPHAASCRRKWAAVNWFRYLGPHRRPLTRWAPSQCIVQERGPRLKPQCGVGVLMERASYAP
jgi:hypothetical protein